MSGRNFYTVRSQQGEALVGTESFEEALEFFEREDFARIYVSVWDGEGEDIYRSIENINITDVVLMMQGKSIQAQIQQFDRLRGLQL